MGRGGSTLLNKGGRRLRGRGRRLGHPTVRGRGKLAGCEPVTLSHNIPSSAAHPFPPSIVFYFALAGILRGILLANPHLNPQHGGEAKQKGGQGAPLTAGTYRSIVQHPAQLHREYRAAPAQHTFPSQDKVDPTLISLTLSSSVDGGTPVHIQPE